MLRALTAEEVEFIIECHPEDIPVEGNASAIDDETDATTERWILEQLEVGNVWAWATVIVRARWNGFEGRDVLGCCSYESEAAFTQPGGYFDDMRGAALDDLNCTIARIAQDIAPLHI